MNIRESNAGSLRPDRMQSGSTEQAEQAKARQNQNAEQPTSQPAAGDRVEISDAARAASVDEAKYAEELPQARKALLDIPPLSEDRAADILKRVQEGYYSQPDTLKRLGEQIAQELTGRRAEG